MSSRRFLGRSSGEPSKLRSLDSLPEVAIAAVTSSRKKQEVSDFIDFMVSALERNSTKLNNLLLKRPTFSCALMVGAGPNRFQLQETIYPTQDEPLKLEFELQDSEDHDKVAIAAFVKLTSSELTHLMEFVRYHLGEKSSLKEDVLTGKSMGISYVVLSPVSDNIYRVSDRFVIDTSSTVIAKRKRKKAEPIISSFKRMKRVS